MHFYQLADAVREANSAGRYEHEVSDCSIFRNVNPESDTFVL